MLVYHGSYMEIVKPDFAVGRDNLDFGRGFYVTTLKKQAEKWSRRRATQEGKTPILNVYEFSADNLEILVFEGYTEQWLDFVTLNRTGEVKQHNYDAIYGNIANDDVATVVNDYVRLLNMNRIDENAKQFYLSQLQYSAPNNQYCISTRKGVDALCFIESYELR